MSEGNRCEKIQVDGEWYILCSSVPLTTRKLTLKGDRAFVITDAYGDVPVAYPSELGYYWRDTRFLSGFEMYLNGARPVLLSSDIDADSKCIIVEMTNTDFRVGNKIVHRTSLYLSKTITFEGDDLVQVVVLRNLSLFDLPCDLQFIMEADFKDIFEVRGSERDKRGESLEPIIGKGYVEYRYKGLDGLLRSCNVQFSPSDFCFEGNAARFKFVLEPKKEIEIVIRASCKIEDSLIFCTKNTPKPGFESHVDFSSSNQLLSSVVGRSLKDLEMMLSDFDGHAIPMAGIPWYCALFGRDSIITALELLPWYPELARNVLAVLSRYQARDFDDFTDSEPGKILHELREGEMARLREIPFVPYYGTADATLLYITLAAEYVKTTGDLDFLKSIWENINLATKWMEHYGDINGDGFVEYMSRSPVGLRNQGWKDSHDSIHHVDGALAEPPISVVEVQGYKYQALKALSFLSKCMGNVGEAERFDRRAQELASKLEGVFWMPSKGFYALALDKNGKRCEIISSNAGHLLFACAVSRERAAKVAERLLSDEMFTGYGIRTLSRHEVRYNPMSYHNGSVWPHDCAIICRGLVNYGFKREALKIF